MKVITECGHTFHTSWTESVIQFGPYFDCEVCGSTQAIPEENVNGDEQIVTRNVNDYRIEQGLDPIPNAGPTKATTEDEEDEE